MAYDPMAYDSMILWPMILWPMILWHMIWNLESNKPIDVSPKKEASETFAIDVIFCLAHCGVKYSTEIRSEDIVLFARKLPIWACQMFIHDLNINNPVKL